MNKVAACVLLSGCLALTGCSSVANPDFAGRPASTVVEGDLPVAESSVSGAPEQLAFSSDTCADLEGLEFSEAIEWIDSNDGHDLGSIIEYFAAAEAVGAAAKAQFEAVSNALELGPTETPVVEPGPDPLDRFLEASLAPDLVATSTFLASEVERACGTTVLTEMLWHAQADAWFMQSEPPSGYCDALISADLESMKSLAPDAHADWVQTVQMSSNGEADLLSAVVIDARTTAYYETHCR